MDHIFNSVQVHCSLVCLLVVLLLYAVSAYNSFHLATISVDGMLGFMSKDMQLYHLGYSCFNAACYGWIGDPPLQGLLGFPNVVSMALLSCAHSPFSLPFLWNMVLDLKLGLPLCPYS